MRAVVRTERGGETRTMCGLLSARSKMLDVVCGPRGAKRLTWAVVRTE